MINRISIGLFLLLVGFVWLIPTPQLKHDYSKAVYGTDGSILSVVAADDEQWRFSAESELPLEYTNAIRLFEDEYFYQHFGVNPISLIKACWINVNEGKVVRGGSTISMQVMRMYLGNQPRTIVQKIWEMAGAIKLELTHSKEEILELWSALAPFGGNIVGSRAASQKYYGRSIQDLSTAEYATLAVLPNSPGRIHGKRNIPMLFKKRNFLLKKMKLKGVIDSLTHALALEENIELQSFDLPQRALHFLRCAQKEHPSVNQFRSTLVPIIQQDVQFIVEEINAIYRKDNINNMAAVVVDVEQNEVVAYVGNVGGINGQYNYVDCVQAPRGYGSLLKPILYCEALEKGYFLPNEMIKDIPTDIAGFVPKNFDRKFRGLVSFDEMVSYSYNVPAVRVLNYIGNESFHHTLLKDLNFKYINSDPTYHGLSIILGGAEASLWELVRTYKGLMRSALGLSNPFAEIKMMDGEEEKEAIFNYSKASISHTLEAMKSVSRPKEEQNFIKYGGQQVAWKTGTSHGHKDAWAIGVTTKYAVGVWVGNEDGTGIHNLTGGLKAAPVLFRIFGTLESSTFPTLDEKAGVAVSTCGESGMLTGVLCSHKKEIVMHKVSHRLRTCNWHEVSEGRSKDTLYTPPLETEIYNKRRIPQATKETLASTKNEIDIVYPKNNAIVFVPQKLTGEMSSVALKTGSRNTNSELFWWINGECVARTKSQSELNINLKKGINNLFVIDELGHADSVRFEVVTTR